MQYQYHQLGHLISAATEGAGGWGLAWNHDGFGNLTQQSVIKGSLTGFTLGINGATNRITGQNYDANGNWLGSYGQGQTYDVDNRVRTAGSHYHQETYLYSARNERMVSQRDQDRHRVHFYGADGLLLGIYSLEITQQNPSNTYPVRLADQERIYFGGRLLQIGGEWVATDRLGSVVRKGTTNYKYAPYGQEIGGATANDTTKFATYTRDSVSGLDYALNRYYKPEWGRFTSPDPYMHNPSQGNPQSWNLYSYTNGDPVNNADSTGLFTDPCAAVGCLMAPPEMSSPGSGGGGLVWLGGPLCVGNSWLPVPMCMVPGSSVLAAIIHLTPDSCAYHFKALPTEGDGFYRTNNGSDFYGQAEVIDYIIAVGRLWDSMPDRESVNRPRFGVTGISYSIGGPRPPSVSHRTGVDVDIRPIRSDGLEQAVDIDQTEVYDRDWTAELIGLFRRNTPFGMYVEAVYFEDASINGVRPVTPHRDHFHLRFNTGRTCQ